MSQAPGKRAGKVLMIVAWAAALFLATRFFGQWEDRQRNPNAQVQSSHGEGFIEVRLLGNGQGHFVMDGAINGQLVHFMLDTGATDVAIPEALGRELGLSAAARCSSVPPTAAPKATGRAWPACSWAISACRTCALSWCRAWMGKPYCWA